MFPTLQRINENGQVTVEFNSEFVPMDESELQMLVQRNAIHLKLFPCSESLEMLDRSNFKFTWKVVTVEENQLQL